MARMEDMVQIAIFNNLDVDSLWREQQASKSVSGFGVGTRRMDCAYGVIWKKGVKGKEL